MRFVAVLFSDSGELESESAVLALTRVQGWFNVGQIMQIPYEATA